nr:NERD domain-containing protein [Propionibacterium sp.]
MWQRVVRQLGPDCVVVANLRVTDRHKDHEADLVVLMPDSGVVVVEVKGSHVWVEDGGWFIQRGESAVPIQPVDQARDAQYALRHYVESDLRWNRTRVRWSHHVVLARTSVAADFALPDLPRWQVSGKSDLPELGTRLFDSTSLWQKDARPPTADDVELILEILAGRFAPTRDVVQLAADREEHAQRLTAEQAQLLKVTRLLNRLEIRGVLRQGSCRILGFESDHTVGVWLTRE